MSELTPLIRFSKEHPAQLLAAYLNAKGIVCKVNEISSDEAEAANDETAASPSTGTAFQLSIANPAQKDEAIVIAKEFLANPNASKFKDAAWQSGVVAKSQSSMMPAGSLPNASEVMKAPFTVIIMIACAFVYLAMYAGYFNFWEQALKIQYFPELAANHQWWRLFGPNFLHFSATHIVFNLIWWWIFGSQLERVFGSFSLIILFVVASLFANISQLLASGPNFGGMSGVVYALFGFVWWIGWLRPRWGLSIPNGFVVFLLIWLALGYADVLFVQMANEAHLFGLISGCLLALSLHLLTPKKRV